VGGFLVMSKDSLIVLLTKLFIGLSMVLFAFAIGPILMIWALNTLFPILHIPFTWETWAAAFILSAPFSTSAMKRKKD
jgi:hypothetical protein